MSVRRRGRRNLGFSLRWSDLASMGSALILVACDPGPTADVSNDNSTLLDPPTDSWVLDAAEVMTEAEEMAINRRAQALFASTGDALYVIALPSLEGRTIEETALDFGRGWGVGDADLDNGVVLLTAIDERKVRIEVGYGLEALLTDARAAEIIRDDIVPAMQAGDLGGGHVAGVSAIADLLESEPARPRYRSEERRAAA